MKTEIVLNSRDPIHPGRAATATIKDKARDRAKPEQFLWRSAAILRIPGWIQQNRGTPGGNNRQEDLQEA
jgi:hypothetical protein